MVSKKDPVKGRRRTSFSATKETSNLSTSSFVARTELSSESVDRRKFLSAAARVVAGTFGAAFLAGLAKIDSALSQPNASTGQGPALKANSQRKIEKVLTTSLRDRRLVKKTLQQLQTLSKKQALELKKQEQECTCTCDCNCDCDCYCTCNCDCECECNCECYCNCSCDCNCECSCTCPPETAQSTGDTVGYETAWDVRDETAINVRDSVAAEVGYETGVSVGDAEMTGLGDANMTNVGETTQVGVADSTGADVASSVANSTGDSTLAAERNGPAEVPDASGTSAGVAAGTLAALGGWYLLRKRAREADSKPK